MMKLSDLPASIRGLIETHETQEKPKSKPPRRWQQRAASAEGKEIAPAGNTAEGRSLFGEILDWMFAPLLLIWPLSVGITFLIARSLADAPYDRVLEDRATALAQQVSYSNGKVVITLPTVARDMLRADDEDEIYLQIIGKSNELLMGEKLLPKPTLYDFPEPGTVKLRTALFKGNEIRIAYTYIQAPVSNSDQKSVLIQVGETQVKRTRLANEIIKGVIFPQVIVLPIALGLVWFGLGRGLAPLQSLQRRIRDRNPDDLSPISPRGVPAEISPLIDAFNDLLARLDLSVNAQKRFIADAAHQMKTPLAGLKTQAELASRLLDPKEQKKSLEQIAQSSDRAARMINQLLALARTENIRDPAKLEPIDLIKLTRDAVVDWHDAARRKNIDLGFEDSGLSNAQVKGQAVLLRELLNNLVDNAINYTPENGVVTVSLKGVLRDGQRRLLIEVEDSGPGIGVAEREQVFSRFYRVLGTIPAGSGLGLSIVKEIADQHSAGIELEDARSGGQPPGTRFRIIFNALA